MDILLLCVYLHLAVRRATCPDSYLMFLALTACVTSLIYVYFRLVRVCLAFHVHIFMLKLCRNIMTWFAVGTVSQPFQICHISKLLLRYLIQAIHQTQAAGLPEFKLCILKAGSLHGAHHEIDVDFQCRELTTWSTTVTNLQPRSQRLTLCSSGALRYLLPRHLSEL